MSLNNLKCANLRVLAWNVHGLVEKLSSSIRINKLENDDFLSIVKKHHIVALTETHLGDKDSKEITVQGYKTFYVCRKISKNNRFYGGILILVKEEILNGITIIPNGNETEMLTMKLSRLYFQMEKDLYIIFPYVSPYSSIYVTGRDMMQRLETEIANCLVKGNCFVMGDMNSYTAKYDDFIKKDNAKCKYYNIPNDYIADSELKRNNMDQHQVNEQGGDFLNLCKTCNMRILNGRKLGDTQGRHTYFGPNNLQPSTIDYAFVNQDYFQNVSFFTVNPFTDFSDHCPVTAYIKMNVVYNRNRESTKKLNKKPYKIKWDKDKMWALRDELLTPSTQETLRIFNEKYGDTNNVLIQNIDDANKAFTDVLVKASQKIMKVVRYNKKKKKRKYPVYIDNTCSKLIKEVKSLCHMINIYPNKPEVKNEYYIKRKRMKKLFKEKENLY